MNINLLKVGRTFSMLLWVIPAILLPNELKAVPPLNEPMKITVEDKGKGQNYDLIWQKIKELSPVEAAVWVEKFAKEKGIDLEKKSSAWKKDYTIYAGKQTLSPVPGVEVELQKNVAPQADGKLICIIQGHQPLSLSELINFLKLNINVYAFVSNNGAICAIPVDSTKKIANLPFVRWIGAFKNEYKYDAVDYDFGTGYSYIRPIVYISKDEFESDLRNLGATLVKYDSASNIYYTNLPRGSFEKISKLWWVKWIEIKRKGKLFGAFENIIQEKNKGKETLEELNFETDDSREIINAPIIWESDVSGDNVKVGIYDSGIWKEQEDFQNAILFPGGIKDSVGHGTHVAGIIMSRGTRSLSGKYNAKGVAPGAMLGSLVLDDFGSVGGVDLCGIFTI